MGKCHLFKVPWRCLPEERCTTKRYYSWLERTLADWTDFLTVICTAALCTKRSWKLNRYHNYQIARIWFKLTDSIVWPLLLDWVFRLIWTYFFRFGMVFVWKAEKLMKLYKPLGCKLNVEDQAYHQMDQTEYGTSERSFSHWIVHRPRPDTPWVRGECRYKRPVDSPPLRPFGILSTVHEWSTFKSRLISWSLATGYK